MNEISVCPKCGSRKIRRVKEDYRRIFRGQEYVVSDLEFHQCPQCGERLFDREAMRRIEACSPAYRKPKKPVRVKAS